jgi:RND superfamily putative drug exporter
MLARFASTMYRRRRLVVAAWVLALVGAMVLGNVAGGEHRADYAMPGSDSATVRTLLAERFPEQSGDTVQLVYEAPDGVADPAVAERIAAVEDEVRGLPHVSGVQTTAVSPDGTVGLATVQLDDSIEKVPVSAIESIMEAAHQASTDGLAVDAGGPAVQNAEGTEAGSEQIGLIAALIILLIAFGSVLAAGLPILVALFGVGFSLAISQLLLHIFQVPEWATLITTMIGIGVGIDYALFIVTRYRSALADGLTPEPAVVQAITTAGRAVLFAGCTVVISLLGLCAMGLDYLYGTAAVTVTCVLVVLVASMTLLPAMLGFLGTNIDRLRLPFVRGDRGEQGLWARWSHVVQRRPVVTGAAGLIILLVLAAPYASMRFGYPDAGTNPESLTSRRAYDAVADSFGVGANGPFVVAVDLQGDPGVLERLTPALAATDGVAAVLPAQVNAAGDTAVVMVVPTTGPQDQATVDVLHRMRDETIPAALETSPAEVHVGGAIAAFADESEYVGARLPLFIGAVITVSFLLLLVVFRSVLVALKAAVMNILAIGAAYGVMALALQGGWFGNLIGITEPTPIPAWAPMMMFALLFGLSMDYEVFLLSRIREDYVATGDNAGAVARGMARTGRVISAAAAIMVTVFAAFVLGDQVLVKVIGLGLAAAVLVDATIVRMVLVPSTMELLGDRNWWIPRWLDRVLPHVDVEGHEPAPVVNATVVSGATIDEVPPAESTDREEVGAGV